MMQSEKGAALEKMWEKQASVADVAAAVIPARHSRVPVAGAGWARLSV